jgi:hypothetical protein
MTLNVFRGTAIRNIVLILMVMSFVHCIFYFFPIVQFRDRPNDCVPLTLKRIFPEKSLSKIRWYCNTDYHGTTVIGLMEGWNKITTNKLSIEYSIFKTLPANDTNIVSFSHPYIWCGINKVSGKYTNYHCALIWFTPTNVLMSHSQFFPRTTNYLTETLEFEELFLRTTIIFNSVELTNKKIRIK